MQVEGERFLGKLADFSLHGKLLVDAETETSTELFRKAFCFVVLINLVIELSETLQKLHAGEGVWGGNM